MEEIVRGSNNLWLHQIKEDEMGCTYGMNRGHKF